MISQPSLRKDIYWAVAVAATALFLTVSINLPYLSSYAVTGDSYAVLLNSSRFFKISPSEWLINGFRYYSLNYPEASPNFTYVIRPTQNLFVYLASLIADTPNSLIFIVLNYIGHSLCCALVYLFSRLSIIHLSVAEALLAAILFLGSTSSYELMHNMAFGGDMLAALLGMSSLMMMYVYVKRFKNWLVLTSVITLLVLSVFAKETCIVAPLVVAGYFIFENLREKDDERLHEFSLRTVQEVIQQNWKILLLIVLPSFAYIIFILSLRVVMDTGWATYASTGSPTTLLKRPFRFSLIFFYPLDIGAQPLVEGLKKNIATNLIGFIRNSIAIILNIVSLIGVFFLARKNKYRLVLVTSFILAVIALAVPILLVPFSRFMYLGQMFCIPLWVYCTSKLCKENRTYKEVKAMVLSLVLISIMINPIYSFYRLTQNQEGLVTTNHDARQFQNVLYKEIQKNKVQRVYLINDIIGTYGSLAQLKYVASLAGRNDVILRVVNSLKSYNPNFPVEGEGVKVKIIKNELLVSTHLGKSESFDFPSVPPEKLANLGVKGLINYGLVDQVKNSVASGEEIETVKEMSVSIPYASRNDYLLIGFDPSQPGVHIFRPNDIEWHIAS